MHYKKIVNKNGQAYKPGLGGGLSICCLSDTEYFSRYCSFQQLDWHIYIHCSLLQESRGTFVRPILRFIPRVKQICRAENEKPKSDFQLRVDSRNVRECTCLETHRHRRIEQTVKTNSSVREFCASPSKTADSKVVVSVTRACSVSVS